MIRVRVESRKRECQRMDFIRGRVGGGWGWGWEYWSIGVPSDQTSEKTRKKVSVESFQMEPVSLILKLEKRLGRTEIKGKELKG